MSVGMLLGFSGVLFGEARVVSCEVVERGFFGAGRKLSSTCRVDRREARQLPIWQLMDRDVISAAWRRGLKKVLIRIDSASSDLDTSPIYVVASSRSDVDGLWRVAFRLRVCRGCRVRGPTAAGAVDQGRRLAARDSFLPRFRVWVWVSFMGPARPISTMFCFSLVFLVFSWLVICGFMLLISPSSIGRCGLSPGKRTKSVMFVFVRWRASCFVKWSWSPYDKMKSQHNAKMVIQSCLWLSRSSSFPLCRHVLVKAIRVVIDTLFANRFLLECIGGVGYPDIVVRFSYIMGLRFDVPPLFSAVSLIVTA